MQRWFQMIGIVFLAILLGWQLGVRAEQHRLMEGGWSQQAVQNGSMSPQSQSGVVLANPEQEADIRLMWRVWNLLLEHYVDPNKLDTQKMVQGAAAGLVDAIGDPYTVLMSPVENTAFRDSLSGRLEGIGAELIDRDELIVVVAPIKGSPAQKAGLLPEDVILTVNGTPIEGMNLNEVVSLIRGPKGTTVEVKVARKAQSSPLAFTITREEIHVPSVESKTVAVDGGEIGYIALNQFGDKSIEEFQQELEAMRDKKVKAIVMDLRYNGGGYLEGAVDLVSLFMKEGTVVSVEHRKGPLETHKVSGQTLTPDIPLAILVNQGTASASEITAGALQDYARATIVGKTTFGKGTVQEIIDLPGGSSLRVTVARWLTPKGKDLGKEGVHPDIDIDRTQDDIKANKDPQLDAAVEFLTTGKKPAVKSGSGSGSGSSSLK